MHIRACSCVPAVDEELRGSVIYFNNSDSLGEEHNYFYFPLCTTATATELKIECCTASNQRL